MTPDELLRLYPRETLRWLRRRLGLSQLQFALDLGVSPTTTGSWESRRHGISDAHRAQLARCSRPTWRRRRARPSSSRSGAAGSEGSGAGAAVR